MKVKFAVIKDENFDCSLLETKLLKTFKEVDCEADIVKVEDEIFENNGIQTHFIRNNHSCYWKNIGYRSVSASIFIVLESLSIQLFRIHISIL